MKQLNNIYDNATLNSVIEDQVILLLSKKIKSIPKKEIDYKDVRKAVWFASILAESKNEKHLKKVQDLAILLYLNNSDNIEILKIAYILFSRIGNLTATNHLKKLIEYKEEQVLFSEDIILTQELIEKRASNSIKINERTNLLTDFQKLLFEKINKEKYISISAPTSSGKSFILKTYIKNELQKDENFIVLYIVPSRALINQVSEELKIDIPNITIKNAFIENEIIEDKHLIYVITPERTVKFLNSENTTLIPNLIFIDEIQNVENEDGRGNLFEYVYEELSNLSDKTKIITAGPFISNSKELFYELFSKDSDVANTDLSPVFQLRTIIELEDDYLSLNLFIKNKIFYKLKNIIKIENISKSFNSNIGEGLSKIIKELSNTNESNLIYSSRGDYAEKWALKYSEIIDKDNELEEELQDLIRYVKTNIHSKYFLVNCLEKRVAFHHSTLSEFVRKEIETLFDKGIIKSLFCTSTLLEGVNLPADNLFVIKPEKNKDELTDFEFGNLIGRAGRLKNTLFGTVYCLSKQNKTEWAEDYYQASYTKEVMTSSSRALPEITTNDLNKTGLQIDSPKIKNLITSLRNKALKKDGSLERFLDKQKINQQKKIRFIELIKKSVEETTVPYNIIKKNPTIDPLLQDKLYKRVVENIDDWVIHPNSNFNRMYKRPEAETIEYKNNSFFWQLDSIISRLNDTFNLSTEIWRNHNISISVTSISINVINWIQGNSIGEIIANRIKYYSEDDRVPLDKRIDSSNPQHINREIKEVIKINQKVVTFSLLKYLKLLIDILDSTLDETQKEKYKLTLALPIQIELGTQEPIVIQMITNGIPRTISLNLFKIFKRSDEYKKEVNIFDWLKKQNQIVGLEPIYNKFLRRNNYLKMNQ